MRFKISMNIKQFKPIEAKQRFCIKKLCTKKRLLLLLLSCAMVTGCSNRPDWMRDRSHDYKVAKDCPSLKIPQGMSIETFSDAYDVPMD